MTDYTDDHLYHELDRLSLYRQTHGRGRNPEAYQARHYCKTMGAKVKAELRRRGLPCRRSDDTRTFGPGQMTWQGRRAQ